MDQCSNRHATPAAISTVLADRRGHALAVGLDVLLTPVLTRRSGSSTSLTKTRLIETH
jgi:hypothetical protein